MRLLPLLALGAAALGACEPEAPPRAAPSIEATPSSSAAAPAPPHVATSAPASANTTSVAPRASTAPTSAPAASTRPAAPPPAGLHAGAAMKIEGNVDDAKLVAAVNAQVANVQPCVALLTADPSHAGSFNLRLTIAKDGKATVSVEGPMSAQAKSCLEDGARGWSLKDAGSGRAMLLLVL